METHGSSRLLPSGSPSVRHRQVASIAGTADHTPCQLDHADLAESGADLDGGLSLHLMFDSCLRAAQPLGPPDGLVCEEQSHHRRAKLKNAGAQRPLDLGRRLRREPIHERQQSLDLVLDSSAGFVDSGHRASS